MKKWIIWLCVMLIALSYGCVANKEAPKQGPGFVPKLPDSLLIVDATLAKLIGLAVLCLGLSVAAFFAIPGAHKLAGSLAVGSGCVLLTCLFVKVSLPFVLPVSIGLLVLSVGWIAYRLWKGKNVVPDFDGDGKPW